MFANTYKLKMAPTYEIDEIYVCFVPVVNFCIAIDTILMLIKAFRCILTSDYFECVCVCMFTTTKLTIDWGLVVSNKIMLM